MVAFSIFFNYLPNAFPEKCPPFPEKCLPFPEKISSSPLPFPILQHKFTHNYFFRKFISRRQVSFALAKGDGFSDGKIHFGIVNEF